MRTARTFCAIGALVISSVASAATVGVAADTYVMRNSTTNNSTAAPLIVKNGNNPPDNSTDRVTFLRFDTTGLAPVTAASLSLAIHNNAVPAGFQVQLYGIPDGAANENFDASTLTFANSTYTSASDADATDNNVLDASLTLLGTYVFDQAIAQDTAGTSPGNMTFYDAGGALTSFLNADTNNVATFRSQPGQGVMSVTDQYLVRAGLSQGVPKVRGLALSLGVRGEGVPVRDLLGDSNGFRRPGSIISLDPGLMFNLRRTTLSVNGPWALYRNRPPSVPEIQNHTVNGDAFFADYTVIVSLSHHF